MHPGQRRLLEALDDTPSTVTGLARRLGWDEEEVQDGLAALEEEKLAVDWGELWATTWRAKLKLAPGFFRVWIPTSVALGAATVALALLFNGPAGLPAWLAPLWASVAVLSLAYGMIPVLSER